MAYHQRPPDDDSCMGCLLKGVAILAMIGIAISFGAGVGGPCGLVGIMIAILIFLAMSSDQHRR